ncbi:hypothetical protein [Flavobacterium sp. NRK1]|uniref:hypothetical protein n=1 Tax=Flavobacterium sp. NRK1 TaxID=2954929 RepID=UPI002093B686|nr:hypothetical protein [Flavobacterium sp. NRK1]MCO6147626.1 hypothetical protein [Flavobacterium sp. NRK1]
MKFSGKIIVLFLIALALFIIFYPRNYSSDFKGHWSVNRMIINENEKLFRGSVHFYDNSIAVNEYNFINSSNYSFRIINNDSIIICCKKDKSLIKDSLYSDSEDANLEGNYKIKLYNKIIGGGKNAYYERRFNLISKDKSIYMFKNEPVNWQVGIPRGRP